MARDERRRQKALARKKAKKRARHHAQQSRTSAFQDLFDGVSKSAIRHAPIHECLCGESFQEEGIGHIVVSRRLPNGQVATALFLIDIYCLGVKDTFLRVLGEHEYEEFKARVFEKMPMRAVTAPYVLKLIEGAVAYARDLGIEPARNYRRTAEIFADINPAECTDPFVFGKDGKPFYIRGPGEDAIRADQIVKQLTRRCGPDGFHFIMEPPEGDDGFEEDLFDDEAEPDDDAESITDELLHTLPSEPSPEPAPAPEPQEKPKGFFRRLFGR